MDVGNGGTVATGVGVIVNNGKGVGVSVGVAAELTIEVGVGVEEGTQANQEIVSAKERSPLKKYHFAALFGDVILQTYLHCL